MNVRNKSIGWLAAVLAFELLAAGCRPADPTLVKIVSSLPRTGSAKQQSDTLVRGIRMAIEEVGERSRSGQRAAGATGPRCVRLYRHVQLGGR